jgi:hypothetical protein
MVARVGNRRIQSPRGGMSGQAAPQQMQQGLAPNVPQTGLIGSEQALRGGLEGALAGLTEGISQGQAGIQQGLSRGLGQLSGARTQGLGAIDRSIGQGVSGLDRFTGAGVQGQNLQAALAGLQGQEAFNSALMDSPATQFIREQGMRGVNRDQAAIGGSGGGHRLKELSRFNTGLASQDLQNQFNRAGALTGQGLQAAGQIGQLRGQQAGLSSNLIGSLGQAGANLSGQAGQQLGNLGLQGGLFAGQSALSTGQNIAQGRTLAGQQIGANIGSTTSALSNLINQQGGGISDLAGQAGGNLANLLSGAGQAQAGSQQQLAALLGNIATQQGSTVAGLGGIPGIQEMQGLFARNIGAVGQASEGAGTAMAAVALSDMRLKDNIIKVGVSAGGHNLYTWVWNDEGMRLAPDQPAFGVMAQEAMVKAPGSVVKGGHGYLMVNYAEIH